MKLRFVDRNGKKILQFNTGIEWRDVPYEGEVEERAITITLNQFWNAYAQSRKMYDDAQSIGDVLARMAAILWPPC